MKVIPELNLNKHPQDYKDGGLVHANNIIVSTDNSVLQTEPIPINSKCDTILKESLNYNYKIKFILSCNKEVVIFVTKKDDDSFLNIIRYNEELNDIDITDCYVEYNGGHFIGTFTYNNENLIIAFSEYLYNNSIKVPLRTVELGRFKQRTVGNYTHKITDTKLQPICPEVLLPYVENESITGYTSYKGFYYIFIRFKISDNTYTQWYNTNTSFLLDETANDAYFELKGPVDKDGAEVYTSTAKAYISNDEDYCSKSIKTHIKYIDDFAFIDNYGNKPTYSHIQIGYVILKKNFSKVYRTNDIDFSYDKEITFSFNPKFAVEISLDEILTHYYNYYNVKTLDNYNNKLYIGNYIEDKDITNIEGLGLSLDAEFSQADIFNPGEGEPGIGEEDHYTYELLLRTSSGEESSQGTIKAYKDDNGEFYYTMDDCFVFFYNSDSYGKVLYLGNFYGMQYNSNKPNFTIKKKNYTANDFNTKIHAVDGDNYPPLICWVSMPSRYDVDGFPEAIEPGLKRYSLNGTDPKNYRVYPEQEFTYPNLNISVKITYPGGYAWEAMGVSGQTVRGVVKRVNSDGTISFIYDNSKDFLFSSVNRALPFSTLESLNNEYTGATCFQGAYFPDPTEWDYNKGGWSSLITGDNSLAAGYKFVWVLKAYDKDNNLLWERRDKEFVENTISLASTRAISEEEVPIGLAVDKDGGCNMPNNAYNFFVHFVDKYGIATKGYNLSNFNVSVAYDIVYKNDIGNRIIRIGDNQAIKFKLSSVPKEYCGYFFSYEKPEFERVYFCNLNIVKENNNATNIINCYCGEFDLLDTIDWSFNQIVFIKGVGVSNKDSLGFSGGSSGNLENKNALNQKPASNIDYEVVGIRNITSKKILVADSADNMGQQSCIQITVDGSPMGNNISFFGFLTKKYITEEQEDGTYSIDAYNSTNKTLIPCSPIQYGSTPVYINTKTAFNTHIYYLAYKQGLIFNTVTNQFNVEGSTEVIKQPLYHREWEYFRPNQLDYKNTNNDSEIIVVAVKGLNTSDINEKSFARGKIVQVQNSIDLFEYKHYTYFDGHPVTLDWYNPTVYTEHVFPKNIRRSNIIQDESRTNAWRQFPIEQYKIITENKGDIIKVISIGRYLLIHTEHSLFMFNGDDAIKPSDDNSKNNAIQLFSIDIWDINYKEVLSSTLGKAGLFKEWHGVVGEYGYIWFDADSYRIYRYDNNSFHYIDETVKNFINKLVGYDVNIIEDINRNRLLFNFTKDDNSYILSYNYVINSFISFHSYSFVKGYNTKSKIYLLDKDNNLKDFGDKTLDDYSEEEVTNYNNASINIMFNKDFFTMKAIEYIKYNVREVVKRILNDLFPVEGLNNYYRGNQIRIYNDIFDTGYMDVTYDDEDNIKDIINGDYTKPYWRFGNWHFNYIRNSLDNAPKSRCFGNYFVIEFKFNTTKQVEIENVEVFYTNGELS